MMPVMELQAGVSHDVNYHKVGITSVYEAGGARLVSLMVLDPTTRKETPHRLQVGDVLPVGDQKFKVTKIELAAGAKKGFIVLQKQ
jgi:hypothetical protein